MPFFKLETNLPRNKIPDGFLQSTSKLISKVLGKPEGYCAVNVVPDQLMSFGGSTNLCGNGSLMSIGQLGVKENKVIAAQLYDHVEKQLGIPKDRWYLTFTDSPASVVGYNGTTFHEIFGGS